jgi:hypothetical protein
MGEIAGSAEEQDEPWRDAARSLDECMTKHSGGEGCGQRRSRGTAITRPLQVPDACASLAAENSTPNCSHQITTLA